MASFVHLIDQRRLIGPGGSTVGGSIFFYHTGTSVLAPVYQDPSLTIPATNPVVIAAGQIIPNLYLDDEVIYRRVIEYADGSRDEQDPLGTLFSEGELGLPVGSILDYSGASAPNGFMFCYGQEINRNVYSDLFEAIGTTYGSGNGSTTFNLPDYRGRVSAGKDNMGGVAANRLSSSVSGTTLGAVGGEETHTLTPSEMPSHSHVVNDPGHTHNYFASNGGSGLLGYSATSVAAIQNTASNTTGISINNTGGGDEHNNVQPTIVTNKIIKVTPVTFLSLLGLATDFTNKANAEAIGIASTATNMGSPISDLLTENGTAKLWFEEIEDALVQRPTQSTLNVYYERSIKSLGAVGDGVTNDTDAFNAMKALGGQWYIPDGTYMLDYISGINTKLNIRMSDGAVLKQRVPNNPSVTLNPSNNLYWGIFEFAAGSDGSSVTGGTIDGNREALAPYYPATTRLGTDPHWWGIRIRLASDVTLDKVKFKNTFQEAFYAFNAPRFKALDVDIRDSGVAFAVQGNPVFDTQNIVTGRAKNIGNIVNGTAYYFFQHGAIFAAQRSGRLEFTLDDFCASKPGTDGVATGGGKEPVPISISMYDLDDCIINATTRNYTAPAGLAGKQQAFDWSSVNRCSGSLKSFGFEIGLSAGTGIGNVFHLNLDGNYQNVSGTNFWGLLITYGGVFPVNSTGLAAETTANLTSRDNVFTGVVTRFMVGVRDEGDNTDLSGLSIIGNVTDGLQIVAPTGTASAYPASRTRINGRRKAIGTTVMANGNAGVIYTGGKNDVVASCIISGNAQSMSTPVQPYNLAIIANTGEGVGLKTYDNFVDTTPNVTDVRGMTFVPGLPSAAPSTSKYDNTTSLPYLKTVTMRNTNNYRVGQIIQMVGVNGGSNVSGKVVDINADNVTIATSTSFSYTESLTTLTGTGSTSGSTLTGVGTLFATEVDFKVYLKYGSEYRQIAYVNSNTQAILDAPFSTNMPAGTVLQVVRVNVNPHIVHAQYAEYVNGNVTVGPFYLKNIPSKYLPSSVNFASFPGLDAGSRVELAYTLHMAGTGLVNNIVIGLPRYSQVRNVRSRFDTNITGTSGSNQIHIRSGGVNIKTAISGFSGLTSGVTAIGPTPDAPAFVDPSGGEVAYVSSSGNPTGTVTIFVTFEKIAYV